MALGPLSATQPPPQRRGSRYQLVPADVLLDPLVVSHGQMPDRPAADPAPAAPARCRCSGGGRRSAAAATGRRPARPAPRRRSSRVASGFSTQTGRPADSTSPTIAWCASFGTLTTTASTAPAASSVPVVGEAGQRVAVRVQHGGVQVADGGEREVRRRLRPGQRGQVVAGDDAEPDDAEPRRRRPGGPLACSCRRVRVRGRQAQLGGHLGQLAVQRGGQRHAGPQRPLARAPPPASPDTAPARPSRSAGSPAARRTGPPRPGRPRRPAAAPPAPAPAPGSRCRRPARRAARRRPAPRRPGRGRRRAAAPPAPRPSGPARSPCTTPVSGRPPSHCRYAPPRSSSAGSVTGRPAASASQPSGMDRPARRGLPDLAGRHHGGAHVQHERRVPAGRRGHAERVGAEHRRPRRPAAG